MNAADKLRAKANTLRLTAPISRTEPRSGDQATVHLASGGLKRVTLTERRPSVLLGQHGKALYIYEFKDGWS